MDENELSHRIIGAAIGKRLGLVIDFGQRFVKDGVHRVVNELPD